jgi:hypothetical protein
MTMGGVLTMYANILFFGASSTLRHFVAKWSRNGIEIFAIQQGKQHPDRRQGKDISSVGMTMGGVLTIYANLLFPSFRPIGRNLSLREGGFLSAAWLRFLLRRNDYGRE